MLTRRNFLRQIAVLSATALSPLESLAGQSDEIKQRISDSIVTRAGTKYLQIGNGVELEIVSPEDTPSPKEYQDPADAGIPLIVIPEKSWLGKNVAKNFRLEEFAIIPSPARNKGTGIQMYDVEGRAYNKFLRIDPELVRRVQDIRKKFEKPIQVLSPYRSFTYNQKCGGAKKSRHVAGQAADLTGNPLSTLTNLAENEFKDGGVGRYKTFTHVDTRGYKARWKG